MRITGLKTTNYRTLESLDLSLPTFYTAICGKNDSGKTNIIKALQSIMEEEGPYYVGEELGFSIKEDFPKWKQSSSQPKQISVIMQLEVNSIADTGLYQFLTQYLKLTTTDVDINLKLEVSHKADEAQPEVSLQISENKYDPLQSQEVLKRIQSSKAFFFHNSTEFLPPAFFRSGYGGTLRELSGEDSAQVDSIKKAVNKGLKKIARRQQEEITELLGRLESKYTVGLTLPTFDPGVMPLNITLGDNKIDVDLDNWGSGTRNRTLILVTLFRAHQVSQATTSPSKTTPIIVIEEPESFLHPSAQAEFGRILQDLSEEFKVQVIATTHSPYMLSQKKPESNILLDRKNIRNKMRETIRINTTGDNWMRPFGEALGIDNSEFSHWKDVFFNPTESILLVEGEIDKEYFELIRDQNHGINRLDFSGEIYPYCGCGNLKNTVLLRFLKNRYKRIFVTYDLDTESEIEPLLTPLGFQRGKQYTSIGINVSGKRNIEGLLPDHIKQAVNATHHDLVDQLTDSNKKDRDSARSRLKKLYLDEFKNNAQPGEDHFKQFYQVAKVINKALKE